MLCNTTQLAFIELSSASFSDNLTNIRVSSHSELESWRDDSSLLCSGLFPVNPEGLLLISSLSLNNLQEESSSKNKCLINWYREGTGFLMRYKVVLDKIRLIWFCLFRTRLCSLSFKWVSPTLLQPSAYLSLSASGLFHLLLFSNFFLNPQFVVFTFFVSRWHLPQLLQ